MYKIKLVQENSKVGDIRGNLDLAKSHIAQAVSEKIDLIVFSEMFLTGYPPEDLLLREDFFYLLCKVRHLNLKVDLYLFQIIPLQNLYPKYPHR